MKTASEFRIHGTRINCKSSQTHKVNLTVSIEESSCNTFAEKSLKLHGGVTGFEGFYLSKDIIDTYKNTNSDWMACSGTPNRYDQLIVPNSEMRRAFLFFEI